MNPWKSSRIPILAVGLVLAVVVACAALAAAPGQGPPLAAAPGPTSQVTRGGVLTFRAHGSLGSLDPVWPGGASEARVVAPMYTRLLSMDRDDKLLPLLAKEWKVEANGTVFTFSLRDDVKFHDGMPLTAEDVAYSFNMIINPPKGVASQHKGVFAPVVEKVEALAPHTVRITTKRTVGWFLSHVPIVQVAPKHAHEPKAAESGFVATGLGSGPFKLKSHVNGVETHLVRNENYFKPGLPYLDELRWAVIAENEAAVAAFVTGRLHHSGTREFNQEMIDAIKKQRQVILEDNERPIFQGFPFNFKNPQLAKKRVREALVLALDAQTVIDVAYPGVRLPGSWFPGKYGVPAEERKQYAMFGYGKPLKESQERARQILAEEGIAELRIRLGTYPGPHRTAAEVVVELLGRIGVKTEMKVVERAVLQKAAREGEYDLISPWVGITAFGEPEHFLATVWLKDVPPGEFGRPPSYVNPTIEELFLQLQGTVDINKRIEITQKMDRILLDDMPAKFLGWLSSPETMDPRIRGYYTKEVFHPIRMLESVWLAPQ